MKIKQKRKYSRRRQISSYSDDNRRYLRETVCLTPEKRNWILCQKSDGVKKGKKIKMQESYTLQNDIGPNSTLIRLLRAVDPSKGFVSTYLWDSRQKGPHSVTPISANHSNSSFSGFRQYKLARTFESLWTNYERTCWRDGHGRWFFFEYIQKIKQKILFR